MAEKEPQALRTPITPRRRRRSLGPGGSGRRPRSDSFGKDVVSHGNRLSIFDSETNVDINIKQHKQKLDNVRRKIRDAEKSNDEQFAEEEEELQQLLAERREREKAYYHQMKTLKKEEEELDILGGKWARWRLFWKYHAVYIFANIADIFFDCQTIHELYATGNIRWALLSLLFIVMSSCTAIVYIAFSKPAMWASGSRLLVGVFSFLQLGIAFESCCQFWKGTFKQRPLDFLLKNEAYFEEVPQAILHTYFLLHQRSLHPASFLGCVYYLSSCLYVHLSLCVCASSSALFLSSHLSRVLLSHIPTRPTGVGKLLFWVGSVARTFVTPMNSIAYFVVLGHVTMRTMGLAAIFFFSPYIATASSSSGVLDILLPVCVFAICTLLVYISHLTTIHLCLLLKSLPADQSYPSIIRRWSKEFFFISVRSPRGHPRHADRFTMCVQVARALSCIMECLVLCMVLVLLVQSGADQSESALDVPESTSALQEPPVSLAHSGNTTAAGALHPTINTLWPVRNLVDPILDSLCYQEHLSATVPF